MLVQNNIDTKAKFTQTCKFWNEEKLKNVYTEEKDNASRSTPSLFYDEHKKCMSFVEEPAPQWLIEEALSRGNEVCKEYVKCSYKLFHQNFLLYYNKNLFI